MAFEVLFGALWFQRELAVNAVPTGRASQSVVPTRGCTLVHVFVALFG